MNLIKHAYTFDALGNPIYSLNGAINVHLAGVHNSVVNDNFHQHSGIVTTTTTISSVGDTQIAVVSTVGFSIGDYIQIGGHIGDTTYTKIVNIIGLIMYINRPLGHMRSAGVTVEKIILDLSSSLGTMSTPQSYKVFPSAGQVWHIERIMIDMVHSTAGDLSLFGNIAQLVNGVIMRRFDGTSGTFNTFTVWNTNEDIFLDTASIEFLPRSSGGGSYSTVSFGSFADIGLTIKLDASKGDYLEILIQDNITSLDNFKIKVQGHLEGE